MASEEANDVHWLLTRKKMIRLKSFKRSSEEDKMAEHPPRHSEAKQPRRKTTDAAEELAVRMKNLILLKVEPTCRTYSDDDDQIYPTADPIQVRIRSWGVNDLFMIVDRCRKRPVMAAIHEGDLEKATFVLQRYYSDDYGQPICTLLHKESGGYLAVDEATGEPTVRCQTCNPESASSALDISVRRHHGAQPVAVDETDSTPCASSSAGSGSRPDPCCFFASVPLGKETCLVPKVCRNKCLSYDSRTRVVRTVPMRRGDFVVLDAGQDDSRRTERGRACPEMNCSRH